MKRGVLYHHLRNENAGRSLRWPMTRTILRWLDPERALRLMELDTLLLLMDEILHHLGWLKPLVVQDFVHHQYDSLIWLNISWFHWTCFYSLGYSTWAGWNQPVPWCLSENTSSSSYSWMIGRKQNCIEEISAMFPHAFYLCIILLSPKGSS